MALCFWSPYEDLSFTQMYNFPCSGGSYSGNQENRYVGFGNTPTPEKKEDDVLNNALSSIYSVRQ